MTIAHLYLLLLQGFEIKVNHYVKVNSILNSRYITRALLAHYEKEPEEFDEMALKILSREKEALDRIEHIPEQVRDSVEIFINHSKKLMSILESR